MRKQQPRPIPIVILLQDLEFGGTQRYAVNLLKHIDRRIFSPELWVLRGGMDMAPLAAEACSKIIWLSRSQRVYPWAFLSLFSRLIRYRPQALF